MTNPYARAAVTVPLVALVYLGISELGVAEGAGLIWLWLSCLGCTYLLFAVETLWGRILSNQEELDKISTFWLRMSVWVGRLNWISLRGAVCTLVWALVGGEHGDSLVLGSISLVVLSFVLGAVVVRANQQHGFYSDPGEGDARDAWQESVGPAGDVAECQTGSEPGSQDERQMPQVEAPDDFWGAARRGFHSMRPLSDRDFGPESPN